MHRYLEMLRKFRDAEDGVTAMEYALLGGLIAAVIVVAVGGVGASVNSLFSFVATKVAAATGNG